MNNLAEVTDETLAGMARRDDKELFGEIIRRYQAKLSRYLRAFIRDGDERDDVLQIVFIKAYQNLNGFDSQKKFSSWLYRIAHNEAINHIKKNKRVVFTIEEIEDTLVDETIDAGRVVDRGFLKSTIAMGLAEIPPKYREVLVLNFFEQKSYEEIGDILRLPVSSVGTRIRWGKARLKNYLQTKNNNYGQ